MNHGISVLFRLIPLGMAAFCFGLGSFVFTATHSADSITAGLVVIFLGVVCMSLFATAATIIRQLIHKYNKFDLVFYPLLGYALAIAAIIFGIVFASEGGDYMVPGYVIIGLGFITGCVTTVAAASSRFTLIPENSAKPDNTPNPKGFGSGTTTVLYAIQVILSIAGWVLMIVLLSKADDPAYLTAGSVVGGISAICTSLIGLVASIVRQESNRYNGRDKKLWYPMVLIFGSLVVLWGLIYIWALATEPTRFVGWVLIGLGLICYSISSKVILLAKVWKGEFALANRIPIIPVLTALMALFISAFLYEWSIFDMYYFVPARVVAGFGAICFTLFSIVSILESGTSKK